MRLAALSMDHSLSPTSLLERSICRVHSVHRLRLGLFRTVMLRRLGFLTVGGGFCGAEPIMDAHHKVKHCNAQYCDDAAGLYCSDQPGRLREGAEAGDKCEKPFQERHTEVTDQWHQAQFIGFVVPLPGLSKGSLRGLP